MLRSPLAWHRRGPVMRRAPGAGSRRRRLRATPVPSGTWEGCSPEGWARPRPARCPPARCPPARCSGVHRCPARTVVGRRPEGRWRGRSLRDPGGCRRARGHPVSGPGARGAAATSWRSGRRAFASAAHRYARRVSVRGRAAGADSPAVLPDRGVTRRAPVRSSAGEPGPARRRRAGRRHPRPARPRRARESARPGRRAAGPGPIVSERRSVSALASTAPAGEAKPRWQHHLTGDSVDSAPESAVANSRGNNVTWNLRKQRLP